MRSLLTLSLGVLIALSSSASAQSINPTPAAPLPFTSSRPTSIDGARYDVPRALVEDYIVCAVEARTLRAEREPSAQLVASLTAEADLRAAEADALRSALASCDRAGRIEEGRGAASRAGVAVALERAAAAETRAARVDRSRRRWRTVATVGPLVAAAGGFVAGILLTR